MDGTGYGKVRHVEVLDTRSEMSHDKSHLNRFTLKLEGLGLFYLLACSCRGVERARMSLCHRVVQTSQIDIL